MKEGRKPEYPEKTPDDELRKMSHTKARKCKPQARLEPAHWWQARKGDVLTITSRVAPVSVWIIPHHCAGIGATVTVFVQTRYVSV